MADKNVFDRLVEELSTEERQELLTKIRGEVHIPDITPELNGTGDTAGEAETGTPGFIEKVIIFFIALFSGRPRHEVRESMVFRRAARDLEREFPQIVDFHRGVLLQGFVQAVRDLSENFSVFLDPVRQITGATKEEFYAFLGGMEMPDLQAELQAAFRPLLPGESASEEDPSVVKRETEFKIEDLLNTIEGGEHDKMYMNARQISWLRSMAMFPYGKIKNEFETEADGSGTMCYMSKVIKHLTELADLLFSYPAAPVETLYEALITYRYRRDIADENFDFEQRLKEFVRAAGRALESYSGFMKSIPLVRIIRIFRKDFSYYPRRITGGEDWFLHFRQFWMHRLDDRFQAFLAMREFQELMNRAAVFIKRTSLPKEGRYRFNAWGYETKARYENSLAFLSGFYRNVFLADMNPVLKIVMIDGEFYKEQNRQEFTDAYNEMLRLSERLKRLETELSDGGVKGRQIQDIANELISRPQRARKIAGVMRSVDESVAKIIGSFLENLGVLEKVLKGIVYGEKGGRYDTLSNIGYLGKRGSVSFIVRLSEIHKKAETAMSILPALREIEASGEMEESGTL